MSPAGYERYLRVTLRKMRERSAANKGRAQRRGARSPAR